MKIRTVEDLLRDLKEVAKTTETLDMPNNARIIKEAITLIRLYRKNLNTLPSK